MFTGVAAEKNVRSAEWRLSIEKGMKQKVASEAAITRGSLGDNEGE